MKRIFQEAKSGKSLSEIAKGLENDKVFKPDRHRIEIGLKSISASPNVEALPYFWTRETLSAILGREEYLGHTVNLRTRTKSYKDKRSIDLPREDWLIFKNTHEAIIDEGTWETVQKIRDGKRRPSRLGEMGMLSGMMFCADCGAKLYQVRGKGWTHDKEYFVCATYRKKKGMCSSHQIRNVVVEQLLLEDLRRVTSFAKDHEQEFIRIVMNNSEKELAKELRQSQKEYEQAQARIADIDKIIRKLYEDNVMGKIPEERFYKMSAEYEAEQKVLEERITKLKHTIDTANEQSLNTDRFLALVKKYTEITELDAEISESSLIKL